MKKNRVFGGRCGELLGIYDPESSSWKTCQMSFHWAEPMSLVRLPQSGIAVNGQLFELRISEPLTKELGGFVFHGIPEQSKTRDGLLPTPTKSGSEHRTRYSQGGRPLMYMIMKGLLPTPTVNDSKNTPGGESQWKRNSSLNVQAAKMSGLTKTTGKDFRLNPLFVEEMMGFPIGWTEYAHSETQSSPPVRNTSADVSFSRD